MSSIGKIFVVVNLVLSLVVVGSMGSLLSASKATQADVVAAEQALSQAQAEFQAQLDEKTNQFRSVEREKQRLEEDNQDLEVRADNAERSAAREAQDNQQIRDDLTKLSATYSVLQGDLSAAQQRIADLADQSDSLRRESNDALEGQRQAELARRDAEDRIVALERQISNKDDELTEALARAHEAEMKVELAIASGFNPASLLAMPQIDALVADVDAEYGFVILDKGANDSVEKGFTFEIFRAGDGYLGRVQVDQVHPGHSTAKILPGTSRGEIRRFDNATTRL